MSNLSNAVQERIRSEEAYRLEVRRQLKSAEPAYRRWRTFNSPLVIWLLSSIVLGIVSFGYNQLARWQSERMVNETTAAAVFFEAHFRMKQMDTVLARARANPQSSALPLFLGIKLGGIVSFPLTDNANVWVNGSGTGNRALPSGRGFQNDDFYGYSLLNLWYSYHRLTCGNRPQSADVARLAERLQKLDSIVQTCVEDERAALERVVEAWSRVRADLDVFLEPGPTFECGSLAVGTT